MTDINPLRRAHTPRIATALAAFGVATFAIGCGDDGSGAPGTDAVGGDATTTTTADATEDTTPIEPECVDDDECTDTPDTPLCDTEAGECVPLPAGHQIGWRSGAADSVTITPIYEPSDAYEATDLEFHPERNELWVINRDFEVDGVCSQSNPQSARCRSLEGYVVVIFDPGTEEQTSEVYYDGNGWHFMRRPPALAMGDDDTWASCGEAATGNFEDNPANFIGPTLWSSDFDVFAQPPGFGLNGSHLDMLHATPWCMGIAHETANVYWTFNGDVGSIDRYDFQEPHVPGGEDHSDGIIERYVVGEVARLPGVPSHMWFHDDDAHLYVADTGHGRIVKLDTTTGTPGGNFSPVYEPLESYGFVDGAELSEVVPPGDLNAPSGLVVHDGLIFVTDNVTSRFHAFDLEGNEVRTLDTDLPSGTLAGLAIGPDDKVYFSDMLTGSVYRIDPQ